MLAARGDSPAEPRRALARPAAADGGERHVSFARCRRSCGFVVEARRSRAARPVSARARGRGWCESELRGDRRRPFLAGGAPCTLDAGIADDGVDCAQVAVTGLVILANAALNGIVDGKVVLGWHGGDAFGPVLVSATLTVETTFTGTRVAATTRRRSLRPRSCCRLTLVSPTQAHGPLRARVTCQRKPKRCMVARDGSASRN